MVAEFKIDWARAIEDAAIEYADAYTELIDWARAIEDSAIEYADAYTELQCDADNDHQRDHREALKNLRETIKRGLEVAAAQQPAAQPELTDAEICGIAKSTQTAEPGRDGYILPVSFARAVIAAHEAKRGAK